MSEPQKEPRALETLGAPVLIMGMLSACAAEPAERRAAVAETQRPSPIPVWLDVDPAIGIDRGEVDDGLAMIQAFHSPEIVVRGVSVVYGNAPFEQGLPIARDVVRRFGPPGLGVFAGAAAAAQLGEETEAVRSLAAALERQRLTVLALGPVTNVGSLLRLHPELAARIERVVVVAGRRVGQSFRIAGRDHTPFRDFNFEHDPAAMQVILDSGVALDLAPWEVSSHVWLRQADMDLLRTRSESGRFVAESTASWLAFWREDLGADGFNPFDTLGVGWVTHPELIEWSDVAVWIEESEDDTVPGSGARKPFLFVDVRSDERAVARPEGRRARYAYQPAPAFHDVLVDRLASPPTAAP